MTQLRASDSKKKLSFSFHYTYYCFPPAAGRSLLYGALEGFVIIVQSQAALSCRVRLNAQAFYDRHAASCCPFISHYKIPVCFPYNLMATYMFNLICS